MVIVSWSTMDDSKLSRSLLFLHYLRSKSIGILQAYPYQRLTTEDSQREDGPSAELIPNVGSLGSYLGVYFWKLTANKRVGAKDHIQPRWVELLNRAWRFSCTLSVCLILGRTVALDRSRVRSPWTAITGVFCSTVIAATSAIMKSTNHSPGLQSTPRQ